MRVPKWIENRLGFFAQESIYTRGLDTGVSIGKQIREGEIIKLLWERFDCGDPKCIHDECCFVEEAIALIKGENKATHTHEIEVFGAPCDCEAKGWNVCVCDGIEPCEPEGENK